MAIYVYQCAIHGDMEIHQGMNDVHEAQCPICFIKMERMFTAPYFKERQKMGKTREELFNNLAIEGQASKDWKQYDSYYKQAKGIED